MTDQYAAYRKKSQNLAKSTVNNISLEIMLQYLKPDERRVLYCLLQYPGDYAECYLKYTDMDELLTYYKENYGKKINAYDNTSFCNLYLKCKIMDIDFLNKFPSLIYLDLKDKLQNCLYTYSKLLNRNCCDTLSGYDFSTTKETYASYEKSLDELLFRMLDPGNAYFNLIFLQGILTEIRDDTLKLHSADTGFVKTVLLERIYQLMIRLNAEKDILVREWLTMAYTEHVIETVSDLEDKKDKIVSRIKAEEVKSREKLVSYEDKLKFMQRNNNDALLNSLYEDIRGKDKEIADIRLQLQEKDASENKRLENLNNKIQNLNSEKEKLLLQINGMESVHAELKMKNMGLETKNTKLEANAAKLEARNTELAAKNAELEGMIKKLGAEVSAITEETGNQAAAAALTQPANNQRIGYATLTKNGVEVVTPTGTYPMKSVPDGSLVGEGQFVLIDSRNNFVYSYRYFTQYRVSFQPSYRFGEIKYYNDKPCIVSGGGDSIPVSGASGPIAEGQIVLADSTGVIKIFFRKLRFVLDYYYDIIKYCGKSLWRTINVLDMVCIIENIETNQQEMFRIPENRSIKQNDILYLRGDALLNVFDFKFYSHSCYYKASIQGTAEVKDDVVLLVKSTGEKVIVKSEASLLALETGDIIVIDEYANLIRYEKNSAAEKAPASRRRGPISITDKYKVNHLVVDKKVLIVGNVSFQQSYKLNFLKSGYDIEVIDGYYTWSRAQKYIKDDIDIIVVVVNYVSHELMWAIKENVRNIPVIYPTADGANRILEQLEEYYSEVAAAAVPE